MKVGEALCRHDGDTASMAAAARPPDALVVAAVVAYGLRDRIMNVPNGHTDVLTHEHDATQALADRADFAVSDLLTTAADHDEDAEPVVWRSRILIALEDIGRGLRLWRLAVALGWLDIKLQFRGSSVGPLWLTLSSAIMVGAMGGIYSRLFHLVLRDYLPYLSISMILWQVGVAGVTQDACGCFTRAADSIRSMRLPFSLQALRMLVRSGLTFSYNIVVPIGVYAIFGLLPGVVGLLALPALVIWALNAFAFALLLGSLCARFRDVPQIISSAIQIAFYVTPIIWNVQQLGARGRWLIFNPFYSLLEIVRAPLTGSAPSLTIWATALGVSMTLWAAGLVVFSRSRSRLAFWI
ncbi:ABC transporter permease [Acetobacter sacchari]